MLEDGFQVFLEIAPHPVLGSSIAECASHRSREVTVLTSLRRQRPERETMLQASAGLYCAGLDLNWSAIRGTPGQVVSLPSYPWQRKRHWLPLGHQGRPGSGVEHPFLGRRVHGAESAALVFEGEWSPDLAWLADHRIQGRVLMPAAAIMEGFVAAARAALGPESPVLSGFIIHRPMVLPEEGAGAMAGGSDTRLAGPNRAGLLPGDAGHPEHGGFLDQGGERDRGSHRSSLEPAVDELPRSELGPR